MIPTQHQAFVDRAVPDFAADPRFVGLAAAGSWITDTMDPLSDVDLVAVVRSDAFAEVMEERHTILARLGDVFAAFTGEHVGEPRVIIALYGPSDELLHVDVKFVAERDLGVRVEDPVILWERDSALSRAFAATPARWPDPDPQWIEDRFWVWVHYGAVKLARGELYEALDHLAFLRSRVLGPLGAMQRGLPARGVRFLERDLPELADELSATVAVHDSASVGAALHASVALYRRLRANGRVDLTRRTAAEDASVRYLTSVLRESAPNALHRS